MKEIISHALNLLQLGEVQYAGVRLVHNLIKLMAVKNGVAESPDFSESPASISPVHRPKLFMDWKFLFR
ncbi:hypothetical protein ACFLY4_10485 [Chloroflexota bacterium]